MKRTPLLAAGLLGLVIAGWQSLDRHPFSTPESSMTVSGTSTLHDWSCDVEAFDGWAEVDAGNTLRALVTVEVSSIECGKRVMNRKVRHALRSDDYPSIIFETTGLEPEGDQLIATGLLQVAGTEQQLRFPVATSDDGSAYRFQGSVSFSLEAWGIDRPSAVLGTIKTGDEVTVSFNVKTEP